MPDLNSAEYLKTFIGLLSITNPMGAIAIFLSLCGDRSRLDQNRIARTSASAVAIILLVGVWVGTAILALFGISMSAFQTGGGLLIVLMAISMLHAKQSHTQHTPEENDEATEKDNVAVVPLAIPLMAGPGALSLVIVDVQQAESWNERLILSGIVLITAVIIWLALRLAAPIGARLGITGINIATRIMGLLLAAIGVQMMAAGLLELLPGLGK